MYVDESKRHAYVLAAVIVVPSDVDQVRRRLRELTPPGQPRIHMKAEKTARQHMLVSALVDLEICATVYQADSARHRTDIARRHACLAQLVPDIAGRADHLVLESDQTQDARDRRDLIEMTRAAGCRDILVYEHMSAAVEPLLALPDIIAWAWARGDDWRRRIAPLVERVVVV